MNKISAFKVGLVTFISLLILITSIMWLKGRSLSMGEKITVNFKDVDGLRAGSAVRMMGIRVGQVEEVEPILTTENNHVRVMFTITESGIKIPYASTISIQQTGIIGEKFIEITPPEIKQVYLPRKSRHELYENGKILLKTSDGIIKVGKIKRYEIIDTQELSLLKQRALNSDKAYNINYIITLAGIAIPPTSRAAICGGNVLFIPPEEIEIKKPGKEERYTIAEPLRLKDFLELQLKTANSLDEVNNRINKVLSDETIMDIQNTMANLKIVSAQASQTLDQTSLLMKESRGDIKEMSTLAKSLSTNLISLSNNVNDIVGNEEFKTSLISTSKSLQKSSDEMSKLLSDSKLDETLVLVNSTSKDMAEVSAELKTILGDEEFKGDLKGSMKNLNASLKQLNTSLSDVNELTDSQKEKIQSIINDTSEMSTNLKDFSEKLNKRFLLFRLMF